MKGMVRTVPRLVVISTHAAAFGYDLPGQPYGATLRKRHHPTCGLSGAGRASDPHSEPLRNDGIYPGSCRVSGAQLSRNADREIAAQLQGTSRARRNRGPLLRLTQPSGFPVTPKNICRIAACAPRNGPPRSGVLRKNRAETEKQSHVSESMRRIRWLPTSARKTLPLTSTKTPVGFVNSACSAGPPSPLQPCVPLPKVVIAPFVSTFVCIHLSDALIIFYPRCRCSRKNPSRHQPAR